MLTQLKCAKPALPSWSRCHRMLTQLKSHIIMVVGQVKFRNSFKVAFGFTT